METLMHECQFGIECPCAPEFTGYREIPRTVETPSEYAHIFKDESNLDYAYMFLYMSHLNSWTLLFYFEDTKEYPSAYVTIYEVNKHNPFVNF